MHILKLLSVSAVAISYFGIAAPSVSYAITCQQLCSEFMPRGGMTEEYGYGCQDQIDDNAGNCTKEDGRWNYSGHDTPHLGGYHPHAGRMVVLGNGNAGYREGIAPPVGAR
jgi:hypothetical protein